MRTKIIISIGLLCAFIFLFGCEDGITHPLYIDGDGVMDAEGNSYKTVVIGDQEWMAENLRTDLYCNGDAIQYLPPDERVKVYDNFDPNASTFGKLYNFQAALDTSGLCPCGWHVPTELEFAVLINYLGGFEDAMRKMKSSGSIEDGRGLWTNPNDDFILDGNNLSGFNALPGGYGFYNEFHRKDSMASFWALPTEGNGAIEFNISIGLPYVEKHSNTQDEAKAVLYYSVRCIKDL